MKQLEIQNRRKQMINLLHQNGEVKVVELSRLFHVSDETIRQDLSYLESEGLLLRKYGGASMIQQEALSPVLLRSPKNYLLKKKIVDTARTKCPNKSCTIGLDQGSTVALLAHHLKESPSKRFFTASLAAILELANTSHQVFCFGGQYSANDMSFRNETAAKLFSDISLDICFFGSSGVRNQNGFCTSSLIDAQMKRELLARSAQNIVLLDKTKFEHSSLVQVAPWEAVDLVITNREVPFSIQQEIARKTKLLSV